MTGKILDEDFKESAIDIIKQRHHHDDGTDVELKLVEETSEFERKIIESENEWKLKTQAQQNTEIFSESSGNTKPEPVQADEPQPVQKPAQVMASCNCGQLFSATSSDKANPMQGKIEIKNYAKGSQPSETYTITGNTDNSQDYAAPGSQQKQKDYS